MQKKPNLIAARLRSPSTAIRLSCIANYMLAIAATLVPSFAQEPAEWQAGTAVELEFVDGVGHKLNELKENTLVGLSLKLSDAFNGEAASGFSLEAWIRPNDETNLKCLEAARAFRATRRLPTGSIDLNGVVLAALHSDRSFAIIDPKLDLASANIIAAGTLKQIPFQSFVDVNEMAVLIVGEAQDTISRIQLDGQLSLMQQNINKFVQLVPLAEGGYGLLHESGHKLDVREGTGKLLVARYFDTPMKAFMQSAGDTFIAWNGNEIFEIEKSTLRTIERAKVPAGVADVLRLPGDAEENVIAVLALDGKQVSIRFPDQQQDHLHLPLPIVAERLSYAKSQSKLIAWSKSGASSIIDVARGEVVSALSIASGISAVVTTEKAVFFHSADAASVSVMELASAKRGQAVQLREVRLGPRQLGPTVGTNLLHSLAPSPQILAVHPETNTAFVIDERSAIGDAPPMSAVTLRGGQVQQLQVIDRSLRQVMPGMFQTKLRLPSAGSYELLLSTGIAGMTKCFPVEVTGKPGKQTSATDKFEQTIELLGQPLRAKTSSTVKFRVLNEKTPVVLLAPEITLTSLEYGWQQPFKATMAADRSAAFAAEFPAPGLYGMTIEDGAIPGNGTAFEIIEVSP